MVQLIILMIISWQILLRRFLNSEFHHQQLEGDLIKEAHFPLPEISFIFPEDVNHTQLPGPVPSLFQPVDSTAEPIMGCNQFVAKGN